MKKIQLFSLLACLVFGSLAFVACGDDENDGNPEVPASGDLASQVIGKWYLTEKSQDKVLVNIIEFKADKTGTFGEYKAKANNNWQIEGGEATFSYTVSGKRLVMTMTSGEQAGQSREGDAEINSDGTATVTRVEDGKTIKMTMYRVTNQTPQSLIQELLRGEQGNEQVDRIVGTWIWGEPNMPEGEETHRASAYEFLADHTCHYYNRMFNYVDKAQVLEFEVACEGTYKVDGVKLTITWTSGRVYDDGSGERQLTSDDLGIENIEIMYPSEGGNVGVFFKRYNQNGGTSEEGPFYKAE